MSSTSASLRDLVFVGGEAEFINMSLGCAGALSFRTFIFLSVYRCPYPYGWIIFYSSIESTLASR